MIEKEDFSFFNLLKFIAILGILVYIWNPLSLNDKTKKESKESKEAINTVKLFSINDPNFTTLKIIQDSFNIKNENTDQLTKFYNENFGKCIKKQDIKKVIDSCKKEKDCLDISFIKLKEINYCGENKFNDLIVEYLSKQFIDGKAEITYKEEKEGTVFYYKDATDRIK